MIFCFQHSFYVYQLTFPYEEELFLHQISLHSIYLSSVSTSWRKWCVVRDVVGSPLCYGLFKNRCFKTMNWIQKRERESYCFSPIYLVIKLCTYISKDSGVFVDYNPLQSLYTTLLLLSQSWPLSPIQMASGSFGTYHFFSSPDFLTLKWSRTLWSLPPTPHRVLCLSFVCGKL